MPNLGRVPRWVIENDPTWERRIDFDPSVLKWNKKGTNIHAISSPTSMICDVIGEQTVDEAGLPGLLSNFMEHVKADALAGGNITKYLSSGYLNERINSLSGSHTIRFNNMPFKKPLF
jgi:hypothetical protein